MDENLQNMFVKAKTASRMLLHLTDDDRNRVLRRVADAIERHEQEILASNSKDLARMDKDNPMYDRLQLTGARIQSIASDMRHVAQLPTPLDIITKRNTLPNGIRLHRVSVPYGVIGVVYEARPNVTYDVFSLCFKSGNACVLKGGKDAVDSNLCAVEIIHSVLREENIDPYCVTLMPATHEATEAILTAVGYVDLCIPRGSRRLIDFVRDNARVPVIETGAGVVHTYFDKDGDLEKGRRIINNAKTRRVSVCNALDRLLVHKDREKDLDRLLAPMKDRVQFHFGDYGREWQSYDLSVKIVDSLDEAIAFIQQHSSGHSESIITENEEAARRFQREIDAACVYWNVPTSFTDGAQFGLGAEIGISTQKLGPRGPMGLEEITTYKWIVEGDGQIRE
ncbi:MAG: glutamate-5-semialdehyde dehydrogenase [Paludibacteraceae bacterium]|nr:glutamate-5-semialdehyde dehydrogenase [Paludibacteraceae bacterium]